MVKYYLATGGKKGGYQDTCIILKDPITIHIRGEKAFVPLANNTRDGMCEPFSSFVCFCYISSAQGCAGDCL